MSSEPGREEPRSPIMPDGERIGEGSRYIGVTASGLPVPPFKPSGGSPGPEAKWAGRTDEYRAKRHAYAQYKTRQRKAAKRPWWWNPDGVMERLEEGYRIGEIVEMAIKDCGGRVKLRILHRDIEKWKKLLPAFKEDYAKAMKLFTGGALPKEKWDLFFQAMAEYDGKVEHAAAALGIGKGVIYSMIDSRNGKVYSAEFERRFRMAEAERIGTIRSKLLAKAEGDLGNDKVRLAVLEASMPGLHSKKKTVVVEGGLDMRLSAGAVEQQEARQSALFAGRQRALGEGAGAVIEVTGQVVKEEVR